MNKHKWLRIADAAKIYGMTYQGIKASKDFEKHTDNPKYVRYCGLDHEVKLEQIQDSYKAFLESTSVSVS